MNDVVPTIYDIVGITPPASSTAFPQGPFDGVSFATTFDDAKAKEVKHTQYFEIMGSRGIYHDGWFADAFGPRLPWLPGLPKGFFDDKGQLAWSPDNDKWELYNLEEDWSQANDLAAKMPEKLAQMKELFTIEFARNNGFPVGGGLFVPVVRPDLRISPSLHGVDVRGQHDADAGIRRAGAGQQGESRYVDAEIPPDANGVLYALGGFSGGLVALRPRTECCPMNTTCSRSQRTHIRAKSLLPTGKVKVEVETKYAVKKAGWPARCGVESERPGGRKWASARQRPADVHCKRLPRHRHRPGFTSSTRLLQQSALRLQRNHLSGICEIPGNSGSNSGGEEGNGRDRSDGGLERPLLLSAVARRVGLTIGQPT